jgi:two-component system LytT family sensor kinase
MKKRVYLFSFTFLLFNALLVMARELPGLAHGKFSALQASHTAIQWLQFGGDTLLYYLLALSVYLLLCVYHPRKKFVLLSTLLLLGVAVFFFVGLIWTRLFSDIRVSRYFSFVIIPLSAQIFFSVVFYLVRYSQYNEIQQVELQLQNRQTELSFLRSQVNPHFLFNNLNNIYALVAEESTQALPAIAGLSELLRYMLYDSSETVLLSTELSYIEKYIALQQLRFEQPTLISAKQNCSDETTTIPALLLIPFIENAFKHGQANLADTWLKWELNADEKELIFSCANAIGIKNKDAVGGIGLGNVWQRLNLLYPDRYSLAITEEDDWFIVHLQLHYGK